DGLVIQSLRCIHLRLGRIDARPSSQRLQIAIPYGEHYEFPGITIVVLCRLNAERGRPFLFQIIEIEYCLMKKNSRVKVVKRSDNVGELNARNCKSVLQAQCSEAGLLHGLQCGGRDIGKQITEFLPALAASRKRVVPAQKKSEIILQTAIYRVGKSEGK